MEEFDDIATAALLLNASGVHRQVFPKTYHTRVTNGFALYLFLLSVFLFGYTIVVCAMYETPWEWFILFDVTYMSMVFAFIFCQVPRRVVRENDRIMMVYCCRTRIIPIESVVEVRVVRRRRDCRGSFRCQYPTKCFWGYPTNLDRSIIVVTDTRCNNFFFSIKEMDEFIADNWPEGRGRAPSSAAPPPEPAVLGQTAPAMELAAC
mmetsp:Transcript_86788/g.230604  ORF Transcript_86788/g.230604 Transcript_86788/m.230604 type:complete len:206 (-) Transcript_86788:1-618(-)